MAITISTIGYGEFRCVLGIRSLYQEILNHTIPRVKLGKKGGYAHTGPLKSLALGFSATTVLVWTCNAIILIGKENAWLATFSLLVLLLSLSSAVSLWFSKKRNATTKAEPAERWRAMLFSLQGAALAFWIFDLSTTYYAIDVARVAAEVNLLGWPLGILGALAYYGPTLTLSYVLLFRIRGTMPLYVAVPITVVALYMGLMNLHAGTLNLQFLTGTASVATELGYVLLSLILVAGFAFPRLIEKQQRKSIISDKTL